MVSIGRSIQSSVNNYAGTNARLHDIVQVAASRPAPAKSTGVQYEKECEYCTSKWIESSRKRINHFYTEGNTQYNAIPGKT